MILCSINSRTEAGGAKSNAPPFVCAETNKHSEVVG